MTKFLKLLSLIISTFPDKLVIIFCFVLNVIKTVCRSDIKISKNFDVFLIKGSDTNFAD